MKKQSSPIEQYIPELVTTMHELYEKHLNQDGWKQWKSMSKQIPGEHAPTVDKLVRLANLANICEPNNALENVDGVDLTEPARKAIVALKRSRRATCEAQDSLRRNFRATASMYFPEWRSQRSRPLHKQWRELFSEDGDFKPDVRTDEERKADTFYKLEEVDELMDIGRYFAHGLLQTPPHSKARKVRYTEDAAYALISVGDFGIRTWLRGDLATERKEEILSRSLRWAFRTCLLENVI